MRPLFDLTPYTQSDPAKDTQGLALFDWATIQSTRQESFVEECDPYSVILRADLRPDGHWSSLTSSKGWGDSVRYMVRWGDARTSQFSDPMQSYSIARTYYDAVDVSAVDFSDIWGIFEE